MSTIKSKRSAVAGKVPTTADLELGEIALNTTDGKLYIKKAVGGVESIVMFAGSANLESSSAVFTTTNVDQIADSFPLATYRTAKYLVQMSTASAFHATEVLLIHDGTTVYMTEFATIFSASSLGTINSDISGSNVRLLISPVNANTTIKAQRLAVDV